MNIQIRPLQIRQNVSKSLVVLLNPLAQNDFAVEESFEAVDKIHSKPEELSECGK